MEAGVAAVFSHFAAGESGQRISLVFPSRAVSEKPAAASGCGGAGPSAALPLLPDASSIAFVAAPCIRPRGARNAAHTLFQQPASSGTGGARGGANGPDSPPVQPFWSDAHQRCGDKDG